MARLRIFVSSTYYDLRHIRSSMESFLEGMGYEAVLFESGGIAFHHDMTLADACYAEVQTCHMLVLVIGGRYGSADEKRKEQASEEVIEKMYSAYNSVTKREYETARDKNIPIFIFVDKNVRSEYETFKSNRENKTVRYAHVDSVNIFLLLDDIINQSYNNFVKEFEKFEDISSWLKEQWAGIYSDLLMSRRDHAAIKSMADRLAELSELTNSMKSYTETIMKKVLPPESASAAIDIESKRDLNRKMLRFMKEPMITYIQNSCRVMEGGFVPTALDLYHALDASDSASEFMTRANVPTPVLTSLLSRSNDLHSGFNSLKESYCNPYLEPLKGVAE
ncbi:DUF4062 domain-containing protein [Janthinobacterium psychrotolerans]|uniref:DUF4062 domain-containing protein n=1 Tax=Janthinobacterium psychrotolerans TaxID=1747903 RepID=A0A1A7BYY9_9BURK|nr:DUF4062 domain-containing protein [Janthinobacterium psychrotolerans]OBV37690.1 protein of unknown function (DUF4062) [Janthinobacterium psychrotolerans]